MDKLLIRGAQRLQVVCLALELGLAGARVFARGVGFGVAVVNI